MRVPIVTPAELLLAIAEHETLEATCAALGIERDAARSLLRGASASLKATRPPAARPPQPPAAPVRGAAPAAPAAPGGASAPHAHHARLTVFSDGASRGNPGPAGAGAVLLDPAGRTVERLGRFLGRATNNVAEYEGVLLGLRRARELGARAVDVRADSELLIRQLQGRYKVKNAALQELHAQAARLLGEFDEVKLTHVRRELNAAADEMSNRAIDEEL